MLLKKNLAIGSSVFPLSSSSQSNQSNPSSPRTNLVANSATDNIKSLIPPFSNLFPRINSGINNSNNQNEDDEQQQQFASTLASGGGMTPSKPSKVRSKSVSSPHPQRHLPPQYPTQSNQQSTNKSIHNNYESYSPVSTPVKQTSPLKSPSLHSGASNNFNSSNTSSSAGTIGDSGGMKGPPLSSVHMLLPHNRNHHIRPRPTLNGGNPSKLRMKYAALHSLNNKIQAEYGTNSNLATNNSNYNYNYNSPDNNNSNTSFPSSSSFRGIAETNYNYNHNNVNNNEESVSRRSSALPPSKSPVIDKTQGSYSSSPTSSDPPRSTFVYLPAINSLSPNGNEKSPSSSSHVFASPPPGSRNNQQACNSSNNSVGNQSNNSNKSIKQSLTCDKCDGKHQTDDCPYYKKPREDHQDAQKSMKKIGGTSLLPGGFLNQAKVTRQPGDGSCLFHSMSFGLGGGSTASRLRNDICSFIHNNPDLLISDTPLKDWVKWDAGISVTDYCKKMSHSCW
jgi:hypothetical protein